YRQAISLKCQMAARSPQRLYRLTVPTGAGKTLSSLRYALSHAQEYGKEHIIYIAPYNSILEQNAQAIRQALGETAIILEHHCNVIYQNDEAQEEYDLLAENWQAMIVVTTAVQFLNTLFSAQSGSVRRMHNLCNSIIIFDEIQALPIRIMKIFNLAVNFLTAFCNTTIVLCSATQPLLDKFPENRILPAQEMADDFSLYAAAFQRTTIIDQTRLKNGGLNIAELAEFVLAKQKNAQQVLVVVNTRSCAVNLYEELKQKTAEQFMEADLRENGCKLFHLSNNMCMSNRQEVLEEVKSSLAQEKPLICVSTALIEAGVDISFKSVIRSLIGLDSIIQAAGRCNRNGRDENGNVYIVHISREAENVSRMADISQAQGIMQTVLNRFAAMPEIFDHSLSSKQAIDFYYELYLSRRRAEMDYPVALAHGQSSLLELLSGNKQQWHSFHGQGGGPLLKQAFKTAGSLF
ncbi:MAG: CRISPR-associated helicase Cas3', partial [Clostridiales bacterium]